MNAQSASTVVAIVVSFNTRELTRRALLALHKSSFSLKKIIVVDNASTDGSAEMVKAEFPDVVLIVNEANLGFGKANNRALQNCLDETYGWLVNSDTEVHEETLQSLVGYLDNHPKVAMVGPQMVYPDGTLQSVGGYFPTFFNVLRYLLPVTSFLPSRVRAWFHDMAVFPQTIPPDGLPVDYATGAACLLRMSALKEVGFLGEEYFMYFEETDLAWRLKRKGFDVRVIATPPVMHVYGGSYTRTHDAERLKHFLLSLSLFVRKQYTGLRKFSLLALITLFGRVSVFIKTRFR